LDSGEQIGANPIILNLAQNQERTLLIHWIGESPSAKSLKYLKLDFRLKVDGKDTKPEDLKFSGSDIPELVSYKYGPEGDLEMRIIRKFKNGRSKREAFKKIIDKEIIIQP